MVKKSILFVDDEPNILAGLRRMLRTMRNEMDLNFVESGAAALEFMANNNVDVIVSDMRMPGMDGATLLTQVQEKYPHAIRMMLTGQADEEAILRTVGVAHQFLAKPASSEVLKEVLQRASALQNLLKNEPLKALISKIGRLPSIPKVYSELQQTLKNPECALNDIARIIEKDVAMSVKVLQLVNSAFFGFFKNIDSPARAVNLLGLDTVRALVLGVGVFSEVAPKTDNSFSIQQLWEHSIGVAAFAKTIAQHETESKDIIDQSFIAGLLHDIGKLLLYTDANSKYEEIVSFSAQARLYSYQAEQRILHADHAEAGGYLIGLWGLPGPVVEAVAFHHRLDEYPMPSFCPALAVHSADIIHNQLYPDPHFEAPHPNTQFFDQAGLAGRFDTWHELCKNLKIEEAHHGD